MFGNYLSTKEVVSIAFFVVIIFQFVNMALLLKLSKSSSEVKNYFAPNTNKNTALSGDNNSAG